MILAAGYATRLYPLTLTKPKPLLTVAGKPMLEYVMDNLAPIEGIDHITIVTNAKFVTHFEAWAREYLAKPRPFTISVINDGSTDDSNKLGAIGDLALAMQREQIDDDLIVVAGDNLFGETLKDFGRVCREKKAPVLAIYDVGSLEAVKKFGAVETSPDGQITKFEEKPPVPTTTQIGIALYYYPKSSLAWIHRYLEEKNNPDQPGRLIQWLHTRTPVYTWLVRGLWY
ncbi:MAG TPA: nucleotidyltransferase family protein, partial [Verrucomicrobiae bacterium]|nr:nucleotidyltransferase family protein [Verrucomicrobiae bacterium]